MSEYPEEQKTAGHSQDMNNPLSETMRHKGDELKQITQSTDKSRSHMTAL